MNLAKQNSLEELHSAFYSFDDAPDSFIHALKASCAWWLNFENNRLAEDESKKTHPNLSPIQQKNWLSFCHCVLDSKNLKRNLSKIVHHYLEQEATCEAFFTGYYEPTLLGSLTSHEKYTIPLYRFPHDAPVTAKITRREIREGALLGRNLEIVYVNDAIDAFFLEIQGSGRIVLDNGDILRVGYAGQNGFPFTPIGRLLKERGEIAPENISLFTLKKWLRDHPDQATDIMDQNESYVFFKEIHKKENVGEDYGCKNAINYELKAHIKEKNIHPIDGPIGTQSIPLTPMHSLACDASFWPFGIMMLYQVPNPVLVDDHFSSAESSFKKSQSSSIKAFALTQDTGGAIKGPHRFDLFCGYGDRAEKIAGHLKHKGHVAAFLPKKEYVDSLSF